MATYTGTIADLMANAGRIQAQRIRAAANLQAASQQRLAEIAAAAEQNRAQNSTALVNNLTQLATGTLGDIMQYKAYADRTKVQQQQEARAQTLFEQQQEAYQTAKQNAYQTQRALSPFAAGGGPGDADFGGGPNDPGYGSAPRPAGMPLNTPGLTPGMLPTMPSPDGSSPGSPAPQTPRFGSTPGPTPYSNPNQLDPNRMIAPTREQMLAGVATIADKEKLTDYFAKVDKHKADAKAATEAAAKAQANAVGVTALGMLDYAMGPDGRLKPGAFQAGRREAKEAGVSDERLDEIEAALDKNPELAVPILTGLVRHSEAATKMQEAATDDLVSAPEGGGFFNKRTRTYYPSPNAKEKPDYTLGDSRYSGTTNQPIATNDEAVALKRAQAAAARVKASAEAGESAASKDDTKLMMDGIENGTLPPLLPGRASPQYVALSAEAARRGFDLAGAVTDWVATQKYVSTRNGSQQTRLMQNINSLPALLDTVDALAKQWDAGRFPLLNKANMEAAVNGAYGDEAAVIANELKAQIADVVADLGTVYMGGNSPTDHALKLAETALSANWSRPVLTKMVALARQNVKTRRNSINSTGVQGASADNPYAPDAATGGRERAPLTAPPQAPPGWRYEKNAQGGWTAVQAP